MGQSALIFTLAATFTIVIILIIVSQNTQDTDAELAQYHYKVLAREASSTGLNMTVRRLVAEPYRWSDVTATYAYPNTPHRSGSFTTTFTPIGIMVENFYGWDQDTVDVVSTGIVSTTGGDTTHVIEARYVKGYEDFGLPPAFRKAVFADSCLTLNGGVLIQSTDPAENASIHANDCLSASGGPIEVEGYGTVSNSSDPPADYSHIKPNEESIFEPNEELDLDGDGVPDDLVYEDAPITLPLIDAQAIHSEYSGAHMDVGSYPGTYTLDGDTMRVSDFLVDPGCTCGTEDNPLLVYVDGNLIIGNMIVEGFIQFVVRGDITFNGSVTSYTDGDGDGDPDPVPPKNTPEYDAWVLTQLDNADNTTIGYYAEGDITANGNFSLVGQLYANGDVDLNGGGQGGVDIIGGVTSSDGNITVNGGVTIRFAMVHNSTLLPGLHYIVPEGVRLIAYAEW